MEYILTKGSIIHVGGLPVELAGPVRVLTSPNMVQLINETAAPSAKIALRFDNDPLVVGLKATEDIS